MLELETNPWRIHQAVKPGQAKMISDAWERHERDRRLVSLSAKEVNEVYEEQWHRAMDHFQNEIFVTTLTVGDEKSFQSHAMSENRLISKNPDLVENDRFPKTFVTEVYTNTERVAQTARKRGHRVGASMSLESGWNFLRPLDRKAARAVLKRESPFFLVLAFPCSFWSVLLNLNPPKNGTKMYEEAITLLQFALQLAKDQKSRGCHFVLENPQSSRAWTLEEMQRALEQLEARCVVFHQCRFRLKNQAGDLLRKATRIATSSDEILSQLDGVKCLGNHPHGHIIGGKAVSEPAGHYPWALAKALVVGMEKQFEADFKRPHNTLAIEGGEEAEDETALPIDMNLSDSDQESTEAVTGPKGGPMTGVSLPVEPVPLSAVPEEAPADLPPLHPQEFVQALGNAQGGPISRGWSRHTSSLPDLGTSPFPEAVRAAFEQRRQSVSSAAPSASGESQASKRPAELDAERLREEALQPDPVAPTPAQPPDEVPDEASEALRVTHEVMEMEAYANVHPLRQIQIMAEQDRLNPLEARVRDHGTWRGNWPLPSRTEFKRRQMLKQLWPLGNDDAAQEVLAVLTARKEHVWSHMSDFEKK
ncbi:Copia protein, partial [Durusdinium trenchii]